MIINNPNPLDLRNDKGALWENFLVSERIKFHAFHKIHTHCYFWRTVQKQEIDFIEEVDGLLRAYEFKWKAGKMKKLPSAFTSCYQVTGKLIDTSNFREFLLMGES